MSVNTPVGNVYIQDSDQDPGPVGAGYEWWKSDTGDVVVRNTSNTAWILKGNANQTYMGLLNRGGGIMTGAILGKHGIIPKAGGNFTTAPTISSLTVAAVNYVDEQDNTILAQIPEEVQVGIAGISGISIGSNLAIIDGTPYYSGVTATVDVSGATYADGSAVAPSDVVALATSRDVAWNNNPILSVPAFYCNPQSGQNLVFDAYSTISVYTTASNVYCYGLAIRPGS